jgi:predicted metalloendopeptidase
MKTNSKINIKNIKNIKNKTKKKRQKMVKSIQALSQEERSILCKTSHNTYNTFEDKVDELFKKQKLDIVSTSYNLEKEIVSELKKAVNVKNVQPNDDFYSYINDRWIADYKLDEKQKYIVQIDDFRITQDKVYRELIEIIEKYISSNSTKQSKHIKNAYKSFCTYNTSEQTLISSKIILENIDELIKEPSNVWKMLGLINKNEILSWGCPFVWSLNPDEKNPSIYKCYLDPPQLSLIDIDVYFELDEDTESIKKYKKNYKKLFLEYLDILFIVSFGANHEFNIKDIFDTEFEILNAMACELIKESDEDNYNLITKDEALKSFGFNWKEFCDATGIKKTPDDFVTSNVNYLLCGTKLLLEKWNSKQWRTYWVYLFIRQQCRWDAVGWKNFYNFHGSFERGQEMEMDMYIKPVFPMGFLFDTFLSNEYVKKYNNEQAINYVKTMALDLKTVFKRIIKRNNWMQSKTKNKALKKLDHLKLVVGSPEILREDPMLDYLDDDPWGNILKMAYWRHEQAVELIGKKVLNIPVIDWTQTPPKFIGKQSYVVNAAYTPTENGIYIPLGYIQKPFVDLDERGMEYNLSRIGFTIAHEMSHSLDDWGSNYDEYGKLIDWWTEKDKIEFKKIQKDVIKQYETFASYDNIDFDAEPSVGEDIADISGFQICQEYLRDFQFKNQDILPIQSISFEAFFIYFAIQSRQQIGKKAILAQLKTNPHPLDKYRCNIPLSRTRVFRAIYNVEKDNKMWWHSLNSIWN